MFVGKSFVIDLPTNGSNVGDHHIASLIRYKKLCVLSVQVQNPYFTHMHTTFAWCKLFFIPHFEMGGMVNDGDSHFKLFSVKEIIENHLCRCGIIGWLTGN